MTRLFMLVFALTALFASNAAAQGPVLAFVNSDVKLETPKDHAKLIRSCDKRGSKMRVSCMELLRSFQAEFGEDFPEIDSIERLADMVEQDTELRACSAGGERVEVAAFQDGKVVYIKRPFRKDEMCITSRRANMVLAAGACSQWVKGKLPAYATSVTTNDPQGVSRADIDAAATHSAQGEEDRLDKAREDWDKIQRHAENENKVGGRSWYTPTPGKVVGAAAVATALFCGLTPNHCALVRQETTVCVNSRCDAK